MTYLKVGDGVFVNGEREIDYSVLPSGYVDVLPLRFATVRQSSQPPITVTKGEGGGANIQLKKVLFARESAADLVNRVAAEQREGKA